MLSERLWVLTEPVVPSHNLLVLHADMTHHTASIYASQPVERAIVFLSALWHDEPPLAIPHIGIVELATRTRAEARIDG